jgi:hypothetical protein
MSKSLIVFNLEPCPPQRFRPAEPHEISVLGGGFVLAKVGVFGIGGLTWLGELKNIYFELRPSSAGAFFCAYQAALEGSRDRKTSIARW